MAIIGTGYVKIVPTTQGIGKSIADGIKGESGAISSEGERAGQSYGSSFAGSVGKTALNALKTVGVALGGAIVGGFAAGTKGWAELEQNMGGAEAVFGEFSDEVMKLAQNSASAMGTTMGDYLANINKMGSLFQGSGLSVEDSMKHATSSMQLAADVASVMGVDIESALEAVTGAAKGNYTMMDNLGVKMNETALSAFALEKGIAKTTKEMSEAEKVELAMQMFLETDAKYAGNYARENDTLAGSFTTLKASMSNLLTGMVGGQQDLIDSAMGTITETLPSLLTNVSEMVTNFSSTISQIFPQLLSGLLPSLLGVVINLGLAVVQALPEVINSIVGILPDLLTQIANALVTLAPTLIESVIELVRRVMVSLIVIVRLIIPILPSLIEQIMNALIELAPDLILGMVRLVELLLEKLPDIIIMIVDKLPELISAIIRGLIAAIPRIFEAGKKLFWALVDAIPEVLGGLGEAVWNLITGIGGFLTGLWEEVGKIGEDIVHGIWDGISGMANWLWEQISGFFGWIIDLIKGIFGIESPSKVMAGIGEQLNAGLIQGWGEPELAIDKTLTSVQRLETAGSFNALEIDPLNLTNAVPDTLVVQDKDGTFLGMFETLAGERILRNNINYGLV
jgi:hypothetical protein